MPFKKNVLNVRLSIIVFMAVIFVMFFSSEIYSQPWVYPKEALIEYTSLNPYVRFPDGRPRVSDDIIERMKEVTVVEAWDFLRTKGYTNQFESGWKVYHPDRKLVGRAVTCVFMPSRPDVNDMINRKGAERGQKSGLGGQNSWVIDTLVKDDVIVVDLFGKVENGTFAGDNLATSIYSKTGTGMVIDGAIRDVEGILPIPNFATFVRGDDPSFLKDAMLMGINVPIRIGKAIVMPGDVVLGSMEGIMFIPPHLAKDLVEYSELIRLKNEFGHQRLKEGKYSTGDIDKEVWPPEIEKDFKEWLKERKAKP